MAQKYKIYVHEVPVVLTDEKVKSKAGKPVFHHKDSDTIRTVLQILRHPHNLQSVIIYGKDVEKVKRNFFKDYKQIAAAGGVVINEKDEILMIFRRGKWDLPKGKVDKGETIKAAAMREVSEETGVTDLVIKTKLKNTFHTYELKGKNILKETYWFEMHTSFSGVLKPQFDEDIEEAKWVSRDKLKKRLKNSYKNIRQVLQAFLEDGAELG